MEILVLDTIHGGADLATELAGAGHRVDMVDVYRGREGISAAEAMGRKYDLLVAPIHLDPDHQLLRAISAPRITHHLAVRMLLSGNAPRPMVEVTGARGKTTTAHAIAHGLAGRGILHSTPGTFLFPKRKRLWKRSITPASVLPAAREAAGIPGWLVAEESLGVSGAGDVAVLTSGDDYRIAAGKRSALAAKLESMRDSPVVVVPPGVRFEHPHTADAGECTGWKGDLCSYDHNGIQGEFRNALGELPPYRNALSLAATALCALGKDPAALAGFAGVEGRLRAERKDGVLVVDNANSGTSAGTTGDAATYARAVSGGGWITLVIGEEDRTVCEGFPPEAIAASIRKIHPDRLILVGDRGRAVRPEGFGRRVLYADTLEAARALALRDTPAGGAVVLAVKTWR
jgi:coenzyme F430 synthetase